MEMDPGWICRQMPAGRIVHVVLDNYALNKHPKVRASLRRHARVLSLHPELGLLARPLRQAEPAAHRAWRLLLGLRSAGH